MAARKRTKKKSFSGNHQRSWLWGKHAVLETLRLGRWPVLEVYASAEAAHDAASVLESLADRSIPTHIVSRARLEELSKSTEHQGLVARLGAYPYGTLDQLIQSIDSANQVTAPLVVMCDRIQDSFNFGAILRSCDGTGALAVVVGEHSQAAMTPHVIRSSSGAANYVPVIQVANLSQAVQSLKTVGATIIAADSNAKHNLWECDLKSFNVLILGSEAQGVAAELLSLCDRQITIPMRGQVDSLNVAVAAGIMLYEIRRQQLSS